MAPVVEKFLDGFTLGEGPHWDDKNQCLYFVSMTDSKIHKYVPSTKEHTSAKIGNHNVSIIIPVKGKQNSFVVSLDKSIALIEWDGIYPEVKSIKKLHEVDEGTNNVFNDGKCDKTGRLWIGSMGKAAETIGGLVDKQGTLYSFYKNQIKSYRSEVGISNGIAFDYTLNKMYYTDSFRYRIDQYDIDFETGDLSNMKTVFSVEKHGLGKSLCDGMTIDTNGNIWVAMFGASKVLQIDPRIPDKVLQVVEFPAVQITSVAFGGSNLDELYVTSGNVHDYEKGEHPGSVFRVTGINAKGLPADEIVI